MIFTFFLNFIICYYKRYKWFINNNIINESFISFIITNNKIQKNIENQIINLGQCENLLKSHYEIENDEDLIIFIIDIDKKDEEIKKLVYEVYGKSEGNILTKLDLKLCEDVLINNNNQLNSNDIIKCDNYSIDSILNDSCITCATGYYTKYEDILNNDKYIKCYKSIDGYYLDKTKYFKKCYESCDLCEKEGNDTYHKCLKCKKDYFYELNVSIDVFKLL